MLLMHAYGQIGQEIVEQQVEHEHVLGLDGVLRRLGSLRRQRRVGP